MRSKLFVPGSRPEFFPKALASQADALSFDLEDSVAADRKAQARDTLGRLLADPATHTTGKTLIVRVNAAGSRDFEADLRAVARPGLHLVNLPKVEDPREVHDAVALLEAAEAAHGVATPLRLLLNIESPRGLRRAADLAAAHPRVAGLQLGYGDLFEPLGIDRRDERHVHACMFAVRMAAGEAGVFAMDSAFAHIADPEGFNAEARIAKGLGFIGKSCVHPSQVALANAIFRPSAADIAHALEVVQASRAAGQQGIGAYMVAGRMVDGPFVVRAQAILAEARRHGLVAQVT